MAKTRSIEAVPESAGTATSSSTSRGLARDMEYLGRDRDECRRRAGFISLTERCDVVEWSTTTMFLRECPGKMGITWRFTDNDGPTGQGLWSLYSQSPRGLRHSASPSCSADRTLAIRRSIGSKPASISAPWPDKLTRIADCLGSTLADVFAMAGYAVPRELPTPMDPVFRAKYPDLPQKLSTKSRSTCDPVAQAPRREHRPTGGDILPGLCEIEFDRTSNPSETPLGDDFE